MFLASPRKKPPDGALSVKIDYLPQALAALKKPLQRCPTLFSNRSNCSWFPVSAVRSLGIASLVLPLFTALSLVQELDHRGRSNDPGGFVVFQGKEFFVAGHEKLSFAGFSQREQVTVLGVRRDRAGGQVPAKKREVTKTSGEQFGRTGAKSRTEERPADDVAEFRNERLTGHEREYLPLPGVEELRRRAQGREKGGDQDVSVEDETFQDRLARSR